MQARYDKKIIANPFRLYALVYSPVSFADNRPICKTENPAFAGFSIKLAEKTASAVCSQIPSSSRTAYMRLGLYRAFSHKVIAHYFSDHV